MDVKAQKRGNTPSDAPPEKLIGEEKDDPEFTRQMAVARLIMERYKDALQRLADS